ncbi:MAG: holo-ACP synthase [Rickettsiales bacterium]|jgi:holo-[acyl-carrier protein] synthase|nr:holo-ACP synthase [Rickettsiales bacterium]
MGILGIGIDLLDMNRVNHLYLKYGEKLSKKILSAREWDYIGELDLSPKKASNFIAKRFSMKESLLKAIGIGMGRGMRLIDISIIGDLLSKPQVILNEFSTKFLQEFYDTSISNLTFNVSVSDQANFITSLAIISSKYSV